MSKRITCLLLALLLLGSLFGCQYNESGDIQAPAEFFYPRKSDSFVYGAENGVLGSEIREAADRTGDLNYLLSIYLRGPNSEDLRSPFPAGCTLESVRADGDTLFVVLSAEFAGLENLELTLACASLAKTCFSLSGLQKVRIEAKSEERGIAITLEEANLLLADYSAFEIQPATEAPQ